MLAYWTFANLVGIILACFLRKLRHGSKNAQGLFDTFGIFQMRRQGILRHIWGQNALNACI